MALLDDPSRLAAISIGGQAPTLVAADADFRPTHPAITWLDQRPADEADRLYAQLGQPGPVWGSWPAQAAWFVHHRSAAPRATRWMFGCPDYLASLLTRTASSLLSSPRPELDAAGLDMRLLPPLGTPGTVIGHVDASAADATHLPAGTPVVGGFVDGVPAGLGSGARPPAEPCMNGVPSGALQTVGRPAG